MIEAKQISYRAGNSVILNDVSVTIRPGEITAILGPNGAGKSTLLKCLTAFHRPDSGVVLLEGKPLKDYSLEALSRKRAVLSQSNPISFPFSALDIAMMGRNPYVIKGNSDQDAKVVRAALESVDAWHLKDRIFSTLSGGEQQRIQIARVLSQLWEQENAYLFLDEPTLALDLKHQFQIFDLACKLVNAKTFAICVILHDLNLAMRYADKCVLMKWGKILASGATSDMLTNENIMQVFEVPAGFVCLPKNVGKAA